MKVFKNWIKWAPLALFVWAVAVVSLLYGNMANDKSWFPSPQLAAANNAWRDFKRKTKGHLPWWWIRTEEKRSVDVARREDMAPGMTLIGALAPPGDVSAATLIDADGKTIHKWDIDWFKLWPDATHVPPGMTPKEKPGTHLHGMNLAPNGDLTFIFDPIGMMQLDVCGKVNWKLPELTHHAIHPDEQGNLWTLSVIRHDQPVADLPNFQPNFDEDTILQLSPQGKILRKIRVVDVLNANGRQGMLYNSSVANRSTKITHPDALHTNDIEVFPAFMAPGVFQPGDLMISMRNISTVIVFDPKTLKIRHIFDGQTIRQHDPDFIDGSTITVFDNHILSDDRAKGASRIVQLSAAGAETKILFLGDNVRPFYTDIMGKAQHLPNGGMLLTEATRGRALEVNAKGETVWQYFNQVRPGVLGLLSEAQRIAPETMTAEKIQALRARCPAR